MESHISGVIGHMVKSHHELARILEAKKHAAHELMLLVRDVPDHLAFEDVEEFQEMYMNVSKSVSMYLNGLAALEEAMGDNLDSIMKELREEEEAE